VRTSARTSAAIGVAAALAAAAPAAAWAAPKIEQLVVFKDGAVLQGAVKARATHVHLGGKKCAVGSATPLAALVRSGVPKVRLHDYRSCSNRARDAGGLFVRSIHGEKNKGIDGWVYKVGNRLATAGAADPAGPFGHGRLKKESTVTWFYCHMNAAKHSCQPTLGLTVQAGPDETLHVHVSAYDDRGHSRAAAGATVHAGVATQKTDSNGDADLVVQPGRYVVFAARAGSIRSFGETVDAG